MRCRALLTVAIASCLSAWAVEPAPQADQERTYQLNMEGSLARFLGNTPMPERLYIDAGRRVVHFESTMDDALAMRKALNHYDRMKATMQSPDDIVLWVIPGYTHRAPFAEFEPVPTAQQLALLPKLLADHALSCPSGFKVTYEHARYFAWQEFPPDCVGETQRICESKEGRVATYVYEYPSPLDGDQFTQHVLQLDQCLEVRTEAGRRLLFCTRKGEGVEVAFWASGKCIVRLESLPDRLRTTLKECFEKFPPIDWDPGKSFDPQPAVEAVLAKAITAMSATLDDPLPKLRYSFRLYPFDSAFNHAISVIPDAAKINTDVEGEFEKAFSRWERSAPAEELQVASYREAVRAVREQALATIRDRLLKIHRVGISFRGPDHRLNYSDFGPP